MAPRGQQLVQPDSCLSPAHFPLLVSRPPLLAARCRSGRRTCRRSWPRRRPTWTCCAACTRPARTSCSGECAGAVGPCLGFWLACQRATACLHEKAKACAACCAMAAMLSAHRTAVPAAPRASDRRMCSHGGAQLGAAASAGHRPRPRHPAPHHSLRCNTAYVTKPPALQHSLPA